MASSPNSHIIIRDRQFIANGICSSSHCADAIAVGRIAELTVAHCEISDMKGGDAIRSLAWYTRLIANHIGEGAKGTAVYFVELPVGGSLEMENNMLERGPLPSDASVAVRVMEGAAARIVKTLAVSGNILRDDTHAPHAFVLNWTGTTARMKNNRLHRDVIPVRRSGYFWFLTKSFIHRSLAAAKAVARAIYHRL